MPPKVTVALQRQSDGTYRLTIPTDKGDVSVPVNRRQRRGIDAEERRKKKRGHARH